MNLASYGGLINSNCRAIVTECKYVVQWMATPVITIRNRHWFHETLKDYNLNKMCCAMHSLICIFLFELSLCPFHFSSLILLFSFNSSSDIMKSIGEAIHFLHTINIGHRDIKVIRHYVYLRQNQKQNFMESNLSCAVPKQWLNCSCAHMLRPYSKFEMEEI